jgi:hypothetical protein
MQKSWKIEQDEKFCISNFNLNVLSNEFEKKSQEIIMSKGSWGFWVPNSFWFNQPYIYSEDYFLKNNNSLQI